MWLSRKAWNALIMQSASLLAEKEGWKEIRESFKAERTRLKEDVQRLKEDIARERERADRAVDELLALRGVSPVTPPPKPGTPEDFMRLFEEDEEELLALKKRMETEGAVAVLKDDGNG